MVKTIILIVFILFAIAGISDLIYALNMLFYYPVIKNKHYSIVILKSKYAYKQLNFIWQKIKWQGDAFSFGIIAVIDCINKYELEECLKFVSGKNITLCTLSELSECATLQKELSNGKR